MVWATDLAPVEKLVALCIAEHANRLGEAFPGRRRIALLTGLSEKTVSRSLRKLNLVLEMENVPKRGRPGKTAVFRFRQKGTESPIYKGTESPITPEEKGLSGQQKGTFGTAKRDFEGSAHIEPFSEPLIEPATSRLSNAEAEIWEVFIDSVRDDIPSPAYFDAWFADLQPVSISADQLEVRANKAAADWIRKNYSELTAAALRTAGIPDAQLRWRLYD